MENHLQIVNNRSHYYEFDLHVEGLDDTITKVCFNILSEPFDMAFHCKCVGEHKWGIELPKMMYLQPTTYTFTITAVIDGYFFEAFRGILTVSKSPEVYVRAEDMKMKLGRREEPVQEQQPAEPVAKKPTTEKVEPAQPTDSVSSDDIKEIISRFGKAETTPKQPVKEAKTEPPKQSAPAKQYPKPDPLEAARKIANKLLNEEKKTGDSALTKTEDTRVKDIIREHKKQEADKKAREQARRQRLNEEAKKKEQAAKKEEVLTESTKQPQQLSERDAKAKAILESVKKEDTTPQKSSPAFKRGGTVVK